MEQEMKAKIEKLLEDQEFVKELLQKRDEDEVAALLSKQGIELPKEAVQALMKEISSAVNESLTDEQLDAISGGLSQEQIMNGLNQACNFIQKNSKKIADGAFKAWFFVSKVFKKKK